MATQQQGTVVGVFHDHDKAREAIRALKNAGFREDQIGVASSNREGLRGVKGDDASDESYAGEGAIAGVATGAGIGALWGLGILAGALPAIGPAIAGGTLAVILSSAAAGAAAAGLAGALVGMGMSKEEADYYESEMRSGRTIVTVAAGARRSDVMALLQQHGGYDMSNRLTATSGSAATGVATQARTGDILHSRHDMPTSSAEIGPGTSATRRTASAATGNTVRAHEEQLRVQKTPVQSGEVTVHKEVHTEHKTLDVPVTREEVVIERRPVSGRTASSADLQTGSQEIRIPVKEEQVHVEKQAVVSEEVRIGKRQIQGTEHIDETLRKEQIHVEKHGDVNVRDERKS